MVQNLLSLRAAIRYPVPALMAVEGKPQVVNFLLSPQLPENRAIWRKLKSISSPCQKNASGMTLIINVRLIMRYAERLTDVFLATNKSRYFHVE